MRAISNNPKMSCEHLRGNTLTLIAHVQIGPRTAVKAITHKTATLFHSPPKMNVCLATIFAIRLGATDSVRSISSGLNHQMDSPILIG